MSTREITEEEQQTVDAHIARARAAMAEHITEGQEMAMRTVMDRPEIQGATVLAWP